MGRENFNCQKVLGQPIHNSYLSAPSLLSRSTLTEPNLELNYDVWYPMLELEESSDMHKPASNFSFRQIAMKGSGSVIRRLGDPLQLEQQVKGSSLL